MGGSLPSSFLLILLLTFQAKELQTLHNLRKLFVQDLATRVKKVNAHHKIAEGMASALWDEGSGL